MSRFLKLFRSQLLNCLYFIITFFFPQKGKFYSGLQRWTTVTHNRGAFENDEIK